MCFFGRPTLQYIFGALAIIGAFGWFFSSEERNVQHDIEGAQQLGLFLLAIVSSYIVTLILSSLIQARVGSQAVLIEGTAIWAVPNPSGLNAHETVDSLAGWYRKVATAASLA